MIYVGHAEQFHVFHSVQHNSNNYQRYSNILKTTTSHVLDHIDQSSVSTINCIKTSFDILTPHM